MLIIAAQRQICPGTVNGIPYVGISSQGGKSRIRNTNEGGRVRPRVSSAHYATLRGNGFTTSRIFRSFFTTTNKVKWNIFGKEGTEENGSDMRENFSDEDGHYDVGEVVNEEINEDNGVVSNLKGGILDDLHKKRVEEVKMEESNEQRGMFGVEMTEKEIHGLNLNQKISNKKESSQIGSNKKTSSLGEEEYQPAYRNCLHDEDLAFETGDTAYKAFPDMPIVETDDLDNRVGGANPYKDLGIPEPPILKMGDNYDDWPDVMGETGGMDDPPDAPWRLEAEEIIRNGVEASGLSCSDILWTFHKVEVTVRRNDLPSDDGESGYVDSHQLLACMRTVNDALVPKEEKLQVLTRHELIVATPGSSEILTTDKEFKAFKGFDVIIVAGGPPSPNFRELCGKLVERTFDELIISQKGKLIRIPLVLVREVRLPSAKIEGGDWLESHQGLSARLVENDALVIPSSDLKGEEEEIFNTDDDETSSFQNGLPEEGLEKAFRVISGHRNSADA